MISNLTFLRIMYWNADSMREKIFELYDYLTTKQIHIAFISETYLKPNLRVHSHPDYIMHRLDRLQSTKGGVAILVHRSIRHELLADLNMRSIEAIGIQITFHNHSKLDIYSIYLPGSGLRANQHRIQQHFINDLRRITRSNRNCSYFICGDFNARHRQFNSISTNRPGKLLYLRSDFVVAFPNTPTHIPDDPNRSPSTIDLMITNSLLQYSDLQCEYIGSNHDAVQFDILLAAPTIQNNERYVRAYDQTNWSRYQANIIRSLNTNTNMDLINTSGQVDDMVQKFTESIMKAQDDHVPLVLPKRYEVKLTPEIEFLIYLRRIYRKDWRRTGLPYLKRQVNSLTARIRQGTQEIRNNNWSRRLQNLPLDDNRKSMWKIARYLKNRNHNIPVLKDDDRRLITCEEKAEALANKFRQFHDNPLAANDIQFTDHVTSTVTEYLADDSDTNPDFPTVSETSKYVKSLKSSKAPGSDRVHNTLLKNLPHQAIIYLNFIICCCIKLQYFPTAWKAASVIPIRKPNKDPSNCASYRPISLLSSLSKILEQVLKTRLNRHTEDKEIIPADQHGFQSFKSTTTQLLRVIRQLKQNLNSKTTTGMIMFDIEKAFDRIWHYGLIYKMIQLEYPKYLVHITASFLSQRRFQVSVNGKKSASRDIPYGVPQGCVLSPSLYNIYTHDAPSPPNCTRFFYADDTALISGMSRWQQTNLALTTAAHMFYEYYDKWKINLNAAKTQALLITRRRIRELPHGPFVLNNEETEWVDTAKYLGLTIDKTLTMRPHIQETIERTQNAVKLLYPLIHRKSKLSIDNKILIFKTALRPIYTYACILFDTIAATHLKKLQVLQNRILKMIYDLPWHYRTANLHEQDEIELVQDFCDRLRQNFYNRQT